MIAIISDIHSNREALDAVFACIESLSRVEKVICLGDVVGYGAEPEYAIDVVRERCDVCLMGNHDQALFVGAQDFNVVARGAIEFTQGRLKPRGLFPSPDKRSRWRFLRDLPLSHRIGELCFFHASPRDHVREYVLATDGFVNREKMDHIYECFNGIAFVGHTHQPGLHGPPPDYRFYHVTGASRAAVHVPRGMQVLVNVGSVGQPRDGDPRSCFSTVERAPRKEAMEVDLDLGSEEDDRGWIVRWYRVDYDISATMAKIHAEEALHEVLARRLEVGK